MAISANASILALLKVWYKDGVQNLMFRNSPVLKALNKVRVEGKTQNFAAMYGRGGCVSANFNTAKANAESTAQNVEFVVEPGQLFSVYTMNSKEVQASVSKRGAYMRVAGAKMFAASEGFRKTLGAALYGKGYGEIAKYTVGGTAESVATAGTDFTLTSDAIMKIDVGTVVEFVLTSLGGTVAGTATCSKIDGVVATFKANTAAITLTANATYYICIAGCTDSSGKPLLPVGLGAWLPSVHNRSTSAWTTYIHTSFFGVTRDVATDRLAGAFVLGGANDDYSDTVQKLLMQCRRQGSQADMIVMNDTDFLAFSKEIEASNTFFTQTATKGKKEATTGFDSFAASFSTNYIENIIDDPYCPKGEFYVLDSSAVEIWSYTNIEKLDDGVAGNNPGKQDPMTMDGEGQENRPDGLIIDDYLNVQPGSGSVDGPNTNVTLQFFGSFVVTNPSCCGVGVFKNSATHLNY